MEHPAQASSKDGENWFVGGTTRAQLSRILECILPRCRKCSRSKSHFCLEQACGADSLLCMFCDQKKHRYHKLNEVCMALIDRAVAPSRLAQSLSIVNNAIFDHEKQLTCLHDIIKQCQVLIPILEDSLAELLKSQSALSRRTDPLDKLHEFVEEAVRIYSPQQRVKRHEGQHTNHNIDEIRLHRQIFEKEFNNNLFKHEVFEADTFNLDVGAERQQLHDLILDYLSIGDEEASPPQHQKCWLTQYREKKALMLSQDQTSAVQQTHLHSYLSQWHSIKLQQSPQRNYCISMSDRTTFYSSLVCRSLLISSAQQPQQWTDPAVRSLYGGYSYYQASPYSRTHELPPQLKALRVTETLGRVLIDPPSFSQLRKLELFNSADPEEYLIRVLKHTQQLQYLHITTKSTTIFRTSKAFKQFLQVVLQLPLRVFHVEFLYPKMAIIQGEELGEDFNRCIDLPIQIVCHRTAKLKLRYQLALAQAHAIAKRSLLRRCPTNNLILQATLHETM